MTPGALLVQILHEHDFVASFVVEELVRERLGHENPEAARANPFGCRSYIYNGVNNLQAHYRWYVTDCF